MLEQLMEAAQQGDAETVNTLIGKHPELLNARGPNGESPLIAALYYGKSRVVEQLLALGVSVNVHEAAALGDAEYAAYLLEDHPQLVSSYSFDGWTPLHLSAFFGGEEAAEALIERGADVNARSANKMNNMPIHAAAAGRKFQIVQLLLEHGADPNAGQQGGWTPLQQAVVNFDTSMIRLLLDHGADPNAARDDGATALSIAQEKGYEEIEALLKSASQA